MSCVTVGEEAQNSCHNTKGRHFINNSKISLPSSNPSPSYPPLGSLIQHHHYSLPLNSLHTHSGPLVQVLLNSYLIFFPNAFLASSLTVQCCYEHEYTPGYPLIPWLCTPQSKPVYLRGMLLQCNRRKEGSPARVQVPPLHGAWALNKSPNFIGLHFPLSKIIKSSEEFQP